MSAAVPADPVTVYKMIIFNKRRAGMSREAFRDYYESSHAPLCRKYLYGVVRYTRRYVNPINRPDEELDFDVVTEVWFKERRVFEAAVDMAARGAQPEDVVEDEMRLFDRGRMRFATVIEVDEDLTGIAGI